METPRDHDEFVMLEPTSLLPPELQQQRKALRATLRSRRRALTTAQQKGAARQLCQHLLKLPGLLRARHIGAYMACDGEIDLLPFCQQRQARGVHIYLPVLQSSARHGVRFVATPARRAAGRHGKVPAVRRDWRQHRFGISEPTQRRPRAVWTLDALLIPLVGFDRSGNRLGMGGGFYDRLLADCQRRPRQPRLIGVAHTCQYVAEIPLASWDQAVDCIVSDQGVASDRRGFSRART